VGGAAAQQSSASAAVVVEGVSKRFPLFGRRLQRVGALLGWSRGLTYKVALDDVSVQVAPGEALGIIGENGSGKSTLLRIIAGISRPDAGTVQVVQPVAAILELGLGFHPEFTGRENALLYGALLGVEDETMRERLENVLAFAELGEFIDQPLRTYSSGMAARLAFAVATNVAPRVLVVDEALAVGDGAFQKKCVDRMVAIRSEGRTVLFCSHSMYLVSMFCDRVLWLHQGRVQALGTPRDVIEAYEGYLVSRANRPVSPEEQGLKGPVCAEKVGRIRRIRLLDGEGRPTWTVPSGGPLEALLEVESSDASRAFHVAVKMDDLHGRCVFGATTSWDGFPPLVGATAYTVRLQLPCLPVSGGSFAVTAYLFDDQGLAIYDEVAAEEPLRVVGERWTPSLLLLEHSWSVE
jgi:ABC-type polysaccharide/polyol phosphate transport system ATPase subunit